MHSKLFILFRFFIVTLVSFLNMPLYDNSHSKYDIPLRPSTSSKKKFRFLWITSLKPILDQLFKWISTPECELKIRCLKRKASLTTSMKICWMVTKLNESISHSESSLWLNFSKYVISWSWYLHELGLVETQY